MVTEKKNIDSRQKKEKEKKKYFNEFMPVKVKEKVLVDLCCLWIQVLQKGTLELYRIYEVN